MSNHPEKIVLWIEDKAENDIHHDIQQWCNDLGYTLVKENDLFEFAERLEEIKEEREKGNKVIIKGFIVDLLLSGTNDLSNFGVKTPAKWDHLQEDGGLMLIQHVLRDFPEYQSIPILVLSVKASKLQELETFNFSNTTTIKKRDFLNEERWGKDIKHWIKEI